MSRVIHFEIQATQPAALISFYEGLFDWRFQQWGGNDYWLIQTGPREEPGIDGGLLPRRGPVPIDGQSVNAFVCTVDVAAIDDTTARAVAGGAVVAVPKMAIPGVGWLAYIKDPDGNILGLMQSDVGAK